MQSSRESFFSEAELSKIVFKKSAQARKYDRSLLSTPYQSKRAPSRSSNLTYELLRSSAVKPPGEQPE
jgi:hypothetical protein